MGVNELKRLISVKAAVIISSLENSVKMFYVLEMVVAYFKLRESCNELPKPRQVYTELVCLRKNNS